MARHKGPNVSDTGSASLGPRAKELLGMHAAVEWMDVETQLGATGISSLAHAVAEHPDIWAYIRACQATPGGLRTRILAALRPGVALNGALVERCWAEVFPGEAAAIDDPHVAFGFVDVIYGFWRTCLSAPGGAKSDAPRPAAGSAPGAGTPEG